MEHPKLLAASFEFSQESNCVDGGTEADIEILNIRCESSLGIDNDGDCFFVLKTEQWSIDSVYDFKKLFDRISKVINTQTYGK